MQNGITNLQIFFLVSLTIVSYTAIELPKIMAEASGTGAWFTLIIGSFPFILAACIIAALGLAHPGKTLTEYSKEILPGSLVKIIDIVYFTYLLGIFSFILRGTAEIIKSDFLPRTPISVICALILLAAAFTVSKGVSNLGRLFTFWGFIIFPTIFVLHTLMFFKGDFTNILPIYNTERTPDYIKGAGGVVFAYLGVENLTAVRLSKINGRKAIWIMGSSVLFAALIYIVVVESCFSVLGIFDVRNYKDPLIVAIRQIDVDMLELLRRLDIIFIFTWQMAVFCTLSLLHYSVNTYGTSLLPRLNTVILAVITAVVAYILSQIPKDVDTNGKILSWLANHVGPIVVFMIPLALFIMSRVKKYARS